jgi:membrane associated rhomboid family serine protease
MFDDFKNAFSRYNNAHVQLILINVAIFLALALIRVPSEILGFNGFFLTIYKQFSIPPTFAEFITRPWTLLTYAFAHDLSGILHILFNMLILYWFGRIFTEYLGSDKLIAVYVLGAIAGAVFYLLAYNSIPFYMDRTPSGMVGASAAVLAIVVATATLLPDYTIFLFILGPVRIKYIAGFIVILSYIGSTGSNAGGNIAHLGGALMGFLYTKQLQSGVNWGSWVTATIDWIKSLFRPKPKVKVSYRNEQYKEYKKASKPTSGISQAEIDAILDKISAGGYESLTKDEKEKLFNASKK